MRTNPQNGNLFATVDAREAVPPIIIGDRKRPVVQLTGTDGNVFALLARCIEALRAARMESEGITLCHKVAKAGSYDEALALMAQYCEVR